MTTRDLVNEYNSRPPHGSFFSEDVRQVNKTPAGEQLLPEFNTESDLDRLAESFKTTGTVGCQTRLRWFGVHCS